MPKKPEKPRKDFPLFPHVNGQWAKKIRGKLCYFGVWSDPEAALQKYLDQRDDLQGGRTPSRGVGLKMVELVNRFLTFKRQRVDSGDMSERTWDEYDRTCQRVLRVLGKQTDVAALRPHDFDQLRSDISATRKAVALSTEVQRCRSLFKFAFASTLIDAPVKMGHNFTKATAAMIRKARHARPKRFLDAHEIEAMQTAAGVHVRAMILLGINCGFGQSDLAHLPLTAVEIGASWIHFPRPKTGIQRACPLWPETVEALRASLEKRHRPLPEAKDCFFVTKQGYPLVWYKPDPGVRVDSVNQAFTRLKKRIEIERAGIGFYSLRHTFRTVADAARDPAAIKLIMGHSDEDPTDEMRSIYVESIDDARLLAVTDLVWRWLHAARKSGA